MSIKKTIAKNVASSWAGLGVQIVVTLLLTPVVLSELGLEAYGLWLLLQGLVGYYGMVDMGLRAGVTQSITHRIAAEDYDAVRNHIAAARPFLSKLSALVVCISICASWALPRLVETEPELRAVFWLVVIIQGAGVAVQLPLMPYASVLVGLQRYDLANLIEISTRVLYALIAYMVLSWGGGIVALSVVLAVSNLTGTLCRVLLAHRLVPELRGATDGDNASEVSELFRFGFWNFLIQLGRRLIYYSDTLVVGTLFSAGAIAPYGIAGSLVEYCNSLVKVSTRVLYPTMAALHHQGERKQQYSLYLFATRICLIVSVAFLVIGYQHIRPFLLLWLSNSDEVSTIVSQAPSLFLLIGIAFAFVSLRRPGTQLLLAAQKLKELATVQISEAIINLIVSFALGMWIGVEGVALGTLIPAVGLGLVWHLGAHAKVLETTRAKILLSILPGTFLFGSVLAAFAWVAGNVYGPIETWYSLVGSTVIHVVFAGFILPLGLNAPERAVAWNLLNGRIRAMKTIKKSIGSTDSKLGPGQEH